MFILVAQVYEARFSRKQNVVVKYGLHKLFRLKCKFGY